VSPRFGPAGAPIACKGDTSECVSYVAREGLDLFEVQFTRNVRMSHELAKKVRISSEKENVYLSCHAPYYINLSSEKPNIIRKSIDWLLKTAELANLMGAHEIVFHPGYYRKDGKAYDYVKDGILKVNNFIKEKKWTCWLAPETTGRRSQFGTLDEILDICRETGASPTIDFAHLHGRTNGGMRKKEDYRRVMDRVEDLLGPKAVKKLHIHFTSLYFEDGDEKHHCVLGEGLGPNFEPLAEVIVEMGLSPTIVSESPILDIDSLKMKAIYEGLAGK